MTRRILHELFLRKINILFLRVLIKMQKKAKSAKFNESETSRPDIVAAAAVESYATLHFA